MNGNSQPLFRYVDDDEHRLIRTALTVLGNKLGGKMTDVAEIAQHHLRTRWHEQRRGVELFVPQLLAARMCCAYCAASEAIRDLVVVGRFPAEPTVPAL
ncbi:hypothetical protein Micbo1qcDRAFT_210550 [Microdochium bolleyi]|uniref:Uncharacterized protein n=1 Tax=Microdochium bolleyi TaxID=196109 RepID=A0A136II10_9PEZI|nr:hypothetical protein Micbo1qcDRAFT_210550 [Microdochium bolleyi]